MPILFIRLIITVRLNRPLRSDFALIEDSLLIPQFRSGIRSGILYVYRMHDFRGDSLDYLIPGIH